MRARGARAIARLFASARGSRLQKCGQPAEPWLGLEKKKKKKKKNTVMPLRSERSVAILAQAAHARSGRAGDRAPFRERAREQAPEVRATG
mmetsp:Transcript_18517/g.14992  ORF Transcript_18517/g.14992 Transcript_18517/m.14992 type:complete len:91 (+) Transcript_18517:80-352(+)